MTYKDIDTIARGKSGIFSFRDGTGELVTAMHDTDERGKFYRTTRNVNAYMIMCENIYADGTITKQYIY